MELIGTAISDFRFALDGKLLTGTQKGAVVLLGSTGFCHLEIIDPLLLSSFPGMSGRTEKKGNAV